MVGLYKQSYTKVFFINMPNLEEGLPRTALCYLKEGLKLSQERVGLYKHAYTKIFLINMPNLAIGLPRNALCYL